MPRNAQLLERILERLAALAAPWHQDLVRAMRSELESISDPAERRRFAVGAITAVIRLAVRRYVSSTGGTAGSLGRIPAPAANANLRGPSMPVPSIRQLLGRHVAPFTVTFVVLTTLLLANTASRLWLQVSSRDDPSATLLQALLLAVPSIVAVTIPMGVFIAVAWVFAGLGRDGSLAAAALERHGIRRMILPVVGAATLIAALTLVSNTELLPRANEQYRELLSKGPVAPSDRSMTLGELREAAQNARVRGGADAAARAAAYEVEIQKKFALAAACLFLALAAAAIAVRFPRAGRALVLTASAVVFGGYYVSVVVGEALADQQVVSPFVAMWLANLMLLAIAALLIRRPGGAVGAGPETLACEV